MSRSEDANWLPRSTQWQSPGSLDVEVTKLGLTAIWCITFQTTLRARRKNHRRNGEA